MNIWLKNLQKKILREDTQIADDKKCQTLVTSKLNFQKGKCGESLENAERFRGRKDKSMFLLTSKHLSFFILLHFET